MVNEAAARTKF